MPSLPRIIALIGMPGCGKSTISRHLSKQLHLPCIDSDHLIEEYLGISIAEYFERAGEAAFRNLETQLLEEIQMPSPQRFILSTGGGIVLRAHNRALLQKHCWVIYLEASPEQLAHRLKNDKHRPLLQNTAMLPRLHALYDDRDPLYRSVAHYRINSTIEPSPSIAAQIVAHLQAL